MRVINLGSGSKGNCTLIEHKQTAVLIDAGLNMKDVEERLIKVSCNILNISAIIVSHDHADHIRSVVRLSKKYKIPVYASRECFFESSLKNVEGQYKKEIGLDDFFVGGIRVSTFEVPHDAIKTIGFIFYADGNKVSLVTDVGRLDDVILKKLEKSNLVMIESNYDERMLENGPYPYPLKRRIASNMGHLSNRDSARAILELSKFGTKYFMLMHLSEVNNNPQMAYNTVMNVLYDEYGEDNKVVILLSDQYKVSPNCVFKPREEGGV